MAGKLNKKVVKSRIKKEELNPVFHFQTKKDDDKVLSLALVKTALKSGTLNLSNRGLVSVPDRVWNLHEAIQLNSDRYDLDRLANDDEVWWSQMSLQTLDLSSNVLTVIPIDVKNLLDLTVLNIQDNALTTLPKEIGSLEKLTRLNVSHNKINELPDEFFRLRELRYLNLSSNCLKEISADLSDLVMLESLDLSNNELEALPGGIGFLVRLTELSAHHNHFSELPSDFVNLRNLMKLDLMNNDIKILPKYMGDLRKLELLYLQHNDIEELPDIDGCKQLQELHISNNFITDIPGDFCEKLPNLKVLDLRDNKISKLPDEIAMLQSLMRLDLSNNSINSLPNSLASLANLTSLQLEGNPIRSIRRDIISCGTQRILKTLRDRAGSPLKPKDSNISYIGGLIPEKKFPDKYQMKKGRSLTLCGKNLDEIPDVVFREAKEAEIGIVDLSKNKFHKLPDGLVEISADLSELNMNYNLLTEVQPFVVQFGNIKYINLSCNHLEQLPDEFGALVTLREVNIANNRFKHFPNCIFNLINLEIILACDNKIEEIDASETGFGALKRLATLDLSNNNIGNVPPILGNLTNITTLLLNGNAFRNPRHAILERGTHEILRYLRDRIPK